jgi:hypothetical protein
MPHHIPPNFTNYLIFRDIFDTTSSTQLLICNHFWYWTWSMYSLNCSWIVVSRRCNGLFQTKKMGCWLFNQMYLWYQACSDVDNQNLTWNCRNFLYTFKTLPLWSNFQSNTVNK